MRIVGGSLKGRRFYPPKNIPARPTTDFAKEGLFNILTNQIDFSEISFLDLFGGTGSLSYEIASRGCENIVIVEKDAKSARFINQQKDEFQLPIQVLQMDVFTYLHGVNQQFELIFAGPPYPLPNLATIPDEVFAADCLTSKGWLILEHNPNHNFDSHPMFLKKRNYGTTIFSIFEKP